MIEVLELIGRTKPLFTKDISDRESELIKVINSSSFLVIGGAGSIGQAVTKEIFKRSPKKLHVVDISENNLVELVRDLRSSYGYFEGEFKTFALDVASVEYDAFIKSDGQYDYVLNLSALKHVRSEKDPYTLMRMIEVNILNTEKTIKQAIAGGAKKYFCVSTDKAANPVNMMGASKRIMEMFLLKYSQDIEISTARFANVAFSDGSLLHGFEQRIKKNQPIVAPNDIKRYFVTPQESGELCLLSCIFGKSGDIFFPKLSEDLHLITFSDIAIRYLESRGIKPIICQTEEEARDVAQKIDNSKDCACLFTKSDTTGEKDFEEFFTDKETLDFKSFFNLGVIKNDIEASDEHLEKTNHFSSEIERLRNSLFWNKQDIVDLFHQMLPDFHHKETGKYLDGKM